MSFVLKMAWRDSRASRRRLALFSLSIVLGIAALTGIGSLGDNLRRTVELQTKSLLGSDLAVTSRKPFDEALSSHGLRPRRLRPRSPNLNAFVERWVQSIQVECLDHFIVLGEAHLNYLIAQYVEHFENERPHQGLGNKLVVSATPSKDDVPLLGQVKRRERLGGLLKHYERHAA